MFQYEWKRHRLRCRRSQQPILNNTFILLIQQKSPRNTRFPGYLTFGHTVSYDTKFILLSVVSDYSITVATRPDPTVRPPSRYQTGVLRCANSDFSCDSWGKIQIFRCVRVVFGDFVIMVLSLNFHQPHS